MILNQQKKEELKRELVACLAPDREIRRIIIFGSFVTSATPNDMDVAIFQDSDEAYIPLAMKYRKQTRSVGRVIPLDIVPVRSFASDNPFVREIEAGEIIYER